MKIIKFVSPIIITQDVYSDYEESWGKFSFQHYLAFGQSKQNN